MKHLLFQLHGPLEAWGDAAPGDVRPTDPRPRKSGVLGILAAARGEPRSSRWMERAGEALGFSVLVLRPGQEMADYQTVRTASGPPVYATRRQEVLRSDYTRETWRHYLADAYSAVAFWARDAAWEEELGPLGEALLRPAFLPYLGRKTCVLALPPAPGLVEAGTLAEAFRIYRPSLWRALLGDGPFGLYWEPHPVPGIPAVDRRERRDCRVGQGMVFLYRTREELSGALDLGDGKEAFGV